MRSRGGAFAFWLSPRHWTPVNADALPYTLLLILAELSIGSLWITLGSDLRGGVTRGFVMTMALCIAIAAGLAYWTASGIAIGTEVDGYSIDPGPFDDMKRALVVVIVTSAIYMFCVFMGWDPIGRLFAPRSAGSRDLSDGRILLGEPGTMDPPNVPGVTHCTLGSSLTQDPGHPLAMLLGDGLVRLPSAAGRGRTRTLNFQVHTKLSGMHHFALLNEPTVYALIRGWMQEFALR